MISNTALKNILTNATDISCVAEVYSADAVPAADGFDPNDALGCYAAVDGITFMGVDYTRLVRKFGNIKRTVTKEANTASVEFDNTDRTISTFEFDNGFEGLILVIRLISRSMSTALTDSQILFVGRCDKPKSGNKSSVSVSATYILNTLDAKIPRRKFTKDDMEGRLSTDPEFEGFDVMPMEGVSTYSVREVKRFLFFKWHKTVQKTLAWSSVQDIDANRSVPVILGRQQVKSIDVGYADVGTEIRMTKAWCEGEIYDIDNIRSIDLNLPLGGTITEFLGKVGTANGPTDSGWIAGGLLSRTAHTRVAATFSAADVNEPAPDVVGVVYGMIMPTPTAGVWGGTNWTDNAAAHARWAITDGYYGKLDTAWIDDTYATASYDFNNELIFNTAISDFIFVEAG